MEQTTNSIVNLIEFKPTSEPVRLQNKQIANEWHFNLKLNFLSMGFDFEMLYKTSPQVQKG